MKPNPPFRLPRDDEHLVVVGRNGTGKSQFAAWTLSKKDLTAKPFIVVDYKGEELFNGITKIRPISHTDPIPDEPGLYILHSRPDMDEETENWLWKVWERGNTGLFIDEGYLLPQKDRGAFQSILTQGRSKRIPVTTLSQRPVRISRFVFSEASHVAAFDLTDRRDRESLSEIVPDDFVEWVPPAFNVDGELPDYHARWYSVKNKGRYVLRPVPDAKQIIADIDMQLRPIRRWI
jgi:hypothetical protein